MRVFELFAGTGSVGNAIKDKGWEVVLLDGDMDADIRTGTAAYHGSSGWVVSLVALWSLMTGKRSKRNTHGIR